MYRSEVLDMVNFEWNATRAKEVACQESRAEERVETTKRLTNQFVLALLQKKASMDFITDVTHLSVEEVEKIAKEHQLAI